MAEPPMLTVPYVKLQERRANPRYDWPNENRCPSPFVILQYTVNGCGGFDLDGIPHEVGPGHALLAIPPERSRYYYPPSRKEVWEFRWLNFYGDFSVQLWRNFRKQFGPVPALPPQSPAERLMREIIQLVGSQRHPDPFLVGEMAYQFYLTWWRQLQEQQPLPDFADPVVEAEKFCRQHFRRPLAVKEIAHHVGLTREHFSRLFQERHQQGPAAYLRTLRLKEARRLRRAQPMTLTELAMRTGFPSARQLGKLLR